MALSPIMVELKANVSEFTARMGEARHEVQKLSKESQPHFQKLQEVGKSALLGISGAALALGTVSVKAAIDGEAAHARLAQAVKNSGGSMEELEPKIKAVSGRMAEFGFSNDQVETALGQMTTSLRDPEKAMNAMGLAADLARYKHISLADASLTVAKAMEGQLRPLKQLGIDLPAAAGGALKLQRAHEGLEKAQAKVTALLAATPDAANAASKAHNQYQHALDGVQTAQAKLNNTQGAADAITKGLAAAVGGQAAAAAETFQGKLQVATAKLENLAEKIGSALLPKLTALIGAISDVVKWFEKHRTTTMVLAGVIGTVLVAAITAYVASLVAAGAKSVVTFAKMIAAGAAWAAETILKLYIVGAQFVIMGAKATASAAATVAGWVRSAAGAVAGAAVQVASWVAVAAAATAAFIAENLATLGIIAAIAAVVAAAIYLYKHWDEVWSFIKNITATAVAWVKSHLGLVAVAFGPIGIALYALYKNWGTIWGGIRSVVSDVWGFLQPIFNAISGGISSISSALGSLGSAASSVKGALGSVGSVLSNPGKALGIPGFASGVENFSGGMALVGERGPELVNLPRGAGVSTSDETRRMFGGDSRGGGDIHVHVAGHVLSVGDLASQLQAELLKRKGRTGSLGLA